MNEVYSSQREGQAFFSISCIRVQKNAGGVKASVQRLLSLSTRFGKLMSDSFRLSDYSLVGADAERALIDFLIEIKLAQVDDPIR